MWEPVDGGTGSAPCARGKHAAASTRAHLYVLGGRGAGGALPLRDFWRYSFVSNKWERLESSGDVPPALQEHSMTAHGGSLYVFGGEPALSTDTPLWVCDIQTLVWRKVISESSHLPPGRRVARGAGAAPRGRRGHSAHALDDCLLIYGGYQDLKGSTNELWAFHYETETWAAVRTSNPGPARHRHVAALYERALYVHGGSCDLRDTADLWRYDTMSRIWRQVRTPPRLSPAARAGHAGLRAGPHLYVYGGQAAGASLSDLWRLHFVSEVWERLECGLSGAPPPLVDAALLPARRPRPRRPPPAPRAAPPRLRRAPRCSYRPLPAAPDSEESLRGSPAPLPRSRSAHALRRRPAPAPRDADLLDLHDLRGLSHEPISVPDFADMILPTPVLSPIEATKLVYLDSDEEEDVRREMEALRKQNGAMLAELGARTAALAKSASVRFSGESVTILTEEEGELSTSDYASAERVSGGSGFSNPHYLGPDPAGLARGAQRGGQRGGQGDLIELRELRADLQDEEEEGALLLVGGRAPPHRARLTSSLALWTYCID